MKKINVPNNYEFRERYIHFPTNWRKIDIEDVIKYLIQLHDVTYNIELDSITEKPVVYLANKNNHMRRYIT